jgi:hypothetical protein
MITDSFKISGFEIECYQHFKRLLADGVGKLLPSEVRTEERSPVVG